MKGRRDTVARIRKTARGSTHITPIALQAPLASLVENCEWSWDSTSLLHIDHPEDATDGSGLVHADMFSCL